MKRSEVDEPFFREWIRRGPGQRRSLERARLLLHALSIDPQELPPTICVVGSKGKGTAVAAATVTLLSQGLRVGSIMSPAFRTLRERIRINGVAIDEAVYGALSAKLSNALEQLPETHDGYLSPSGAYMLAGIRALLDQNVDCLVIEEGIGGQSDEIGLFQPDVLLVTQIFLEHADVLGESIEAIARDLVGICTRDTRSLLTICGQDAEVSAVIEEIASESGVTVLVPLLTTREASALQHVPGLSRGNAELGVAGAITLMNDINHSEIALTLRNLWLPGRLSTHTSPNGSSKWVADAAINATGASAALEWCRENVGEPDLVLVSVPISKDRDGCLAALHGLPVQEIAGSPHLEFAMQHDGLPLPDLSTYLATQTPNQGLVLALGTVTFIGDVLEYLDVNTATWIQPG
jgi:dihydrofolate synthase/folylpolyglutamate synthase